MSDPQTVETTPLDDLLAAVANPLRRQLIDRLSHGPETAGELASGAGVSMPSMSRHLRILEQAGLIVRMKQGRNHVIELRPDALLPAGDWLNSVIPAAVTPLVQPQSSPRTPSFVASETSQPLSQSESRPKSPRSEPLPVDLSPVLEPEVVAHEGEEIDPVEGPDLSPDSLSSLVQQLRGRRG